MSIISLGEAVQLLREDQVVAIPTETVYGLAGRISSPSALELIFKTKERPLFDPLIVHVRDIEQARELATQWHPAIVQLAQTFWPGPLTVVVPKSDSVNPLITAGLETVGIRAPNHRIAQQILTKLGEPFAAPSANRFKQTSPTRSEHVLTEFEGRVPVVEGGASHIGVESTVIRLNVDKMELEILRPGQISAAQIEQALKKEYPQIKVTRVISQASPGHLEQHYQPRLPLVISHVQDSKKEGEQLAAKYGEAKTFFLDLSKDATLAARELYHQLHQFATRAEGVIVYRAGSEWNSAPWEALVDRLSRASSFVIQK